MKILFSRRGITALLVVGVLATTFASAATAGGGRGHARRFGAWTQVMQSSCDPRVALGFDSYSRRDERPAFRADVSWQSGRGDGCAVVSHPPHRWYDGRLYCAGQNADGSWRSNVYRCEDDYGRKKVNLQGWDPRCEPQPPCN